MVNLALLLLPVAAFPQWEFDSPGALQTWVPNAHLANVAVRDGVVCADTTDWDPFFTCRSVEFAATPWEYVHIRMKASRAGVCDLFWSGTLEGQYGGLTEQKKLRFAVAGTGDWEDVVLFPFWQREGTIRQFRLDVFANAHFEIDFVRILEWGNAANLQQTTFESGELLQNRIERSPVLWTNRLDLPASSAKFATLVVNTERSGDAANVCWGTSERVGMQRAAVPLRQGEHIYNIPISENDGWCGTIAALGLELPAGARVLNVALGNEPGGEADVAITYLGFENGVNRAERPCRVLARFKNFGGAAARGFTAELSLPEGLTLSTGETTQAVGDLPYNETADVVWTVVTAEAVTRAISVNGERTELKFEPARAIQSADYVPEPRPITTSIDVAAYYFPGWEAPKKWEPVRNTAPNRKPLLGYYDEGNPECVDWQVKWAVENGIGVFLVDWYWVAGKRSLEHWFEAYRKARYRDQLKVAIMWANHNPPKTHSREDWRAVTQHWIDHYFNLPAYYRIDEKPAVFLWSPDNLRNDLGGVDAVKEAIAESQQMAKDAGYEGITFVAMGYSFAKSHIENLVVEGFSGITTYHEWGAIAPDTNVSKHALFDDVVRTVTTSWRQKNTDAGALMYYPVVDTGWDSRPWHGDKAFVIDGRTPAHFRSLLEQAKAFCGETNKPLVILGPVNEWGEGSYIEPCTEFGFEMTECVREVFGVKPETGWPENIGPADVNRGPYDFRN
ncbi:MAG: glycoside hydrolase family 99-like domain-containing protein [Candidatus Hydrogenedentes bacterium]|nr:glycoside hydrolase family 99-like domain-containing protein [Candidatus Hydrogenedentota bacterium]